MGNCLLFVCIKSFKKFKRNKKDSLVNTKVFGILNLDLNFLLWIKKCAYLISPNFPFSHSPDFVYTRETSIHNFVIWNMLFVTNDSLNYPVSEGQAPVIRSCSAHFRENTGLSQKVTSIRSNNFSHDFFFPFVLYQCLNTQYA